MTDEVERKAGALDHQKKAVTSLVSALAHSIDMNGCTVMVV
jgi:hypothetical protein